MITTSSIFLKTLAEAGITHAFVNWGSDHPALLEDLERQRVESDGETALKVVTCPNEMVALSTAQGFAQVSGKPAVVIVHTDVGTQALAGAIHNVDRGRAPVLIYAGASPFSSNGELKGSRNEWIMWLQDIPDQTAVVRQYMRHTAQIYSGKNVSQVIHRSLQIATSEPKGPVYLWARREVMEEEVSPSILDQQVDLSKWPKLEPSALSPTASTRIATALLTAQSPLIITSSLGRNPHAVPALLTLSTLLAIPISLACPTSVSVPFSHPFLSDVTYHAPGTGSPHLPYADVILVIDSDVPWVSAQASPRSDARVFVLDGGDPLHTGIGSWHIDAEMICRADAEVALGQIVEAVRAVDEEAASVGESVLGSSLLRARAQRLTSQHTEWLEGLKVAEDKFLEPTTGNVEKPMQSPITVPNILGTLRRAIQKSQGWSRTLILNEAISSYPLVWAHLQPDVAGSMLVSGGSSLGWALGAAIGASLAEQGRRLIVAIVGDGSFLFGVPSSAYWIARRYNTPFLTIVLNNGGWKSPKLSMLGVHPTGHGSLATGAKLSTGFGPDCPQHDQIAVAASAGWAWGREVGYGGKAELEDVLEQAIKVVLEERRCAVLNCILESI